MSSLGSLGGHYSEAYDINNLGQVTGWAADADSQSHRFLWLPEPAYGLPAGMNDLYPAWGVWGKSSINNLGRLVDYLNLWQNGVATGINDLFPPDSGWSYAGARDINDHGLRFDIEEGFLDFKLAGFQLESSQLEDSESLSRLLLILATATLYLVSTGTAIVEMGKRRWVDPHWFRSPSYLQIGWRWVKRTLAWDEKLLIKLCDKFTRVETFRQPLSVTIPGKNIVTPVCPFCGEGHCIVTANQLFLFFLCSNNVWSISFSSLFILIGL